MKKSFEEHIAEEIKKSNKKWNYKLESSYNLSNFEIRQIFATKHEVNAKRDENGMLVPGTGRIITNEEKKLIFDFILENNYPLTRRVYNLVLNAYIDNEIELNISKSVKL